MGHIRVVVGLPLITSADNLAFWFGLTRTSGTHMHRVFHSGWFNVHLFRFGRTSDKDSGCRPIPIDSRANMRSLLVKVSFTFYQLTVLLAPAGRVKSGLNAS